jgi:hypothetical protein
MAGWKGFLPAGHWPWVSLGIPQYPPGLEGGGKQPSAPPGGYPPVNNGLSQTISNLQQEEEEEEAARQKIKHGGYKKGCTANIDCDFNIGYEQLMKEYFSENPRPCYNNGSVCTKAFF